MGIATYILKTYGWITLAFALLFSVMAPAYDSLPSAANGGCTNNSECPAMMYCKSTSYSSADGNTRIIGHCESRGDLCTQEYNPVKGCDGRIYGNACLMALAGESPYHQGCVPGAQP